MKTGKFTCASTAVLLTVLFAAPALSEEKTEKKDASGCVYELRTYTTNEGKLDDLHSRFRDHTVKMFEKHGMKSVGYWVPTDEEKSKNTLIYILKHKSREEAMESWEEFNSDSEWRKVAKASNANGRILAKKPERVFLKATEYSPNAFAGDPENKDKICQLRIYYIKEGMRKKLDERFEKGTIRLFAKQGIESLCYFHPAEEDKADQALYYIIRFKDENATKTAWKAFLSDPEWHEFRKPYGKPVAKAKTAFMKPTDYSPTVKKEEEDAAKK